jgi:transposase
MVNIRIRLGNETVKVLFELLRQAYKAGDVRLIRRASTLLALSDGQSLSSVAQRQGVAVSSIYNWLKLLLLEGVAGLRVQWKGGRPCKLTATQKGRLIGLLKAGPEEAGFATGCWNTLLIQLLIKREFGVLYNAHYVAELLCNLGFSFQKARFLADHLDEAKRLQWLSETWPALLERAKRMGALILFGDEASYAQWGSLGYTWAPVGQQPLVKTTGRRKAYKIFGLIEFFNGRLFYQGSEGKFNADSYIAFLSQVLAQTQEPLFLVHDNAAYHRAAKVKQFIKEHAARLTVYHLPSYSPDYNPIEFLWRAVKRCATHNRYFPTFDLLLNSVEQALTLLAQHPEQVRSLFGFYLKYVAQPPPQAA